MSDVRDPDAQPEYRVYRARRRLLSREPRAGESLLDDLREAPPTRRRHKPITVGRVVAWLVAAVVGWIVLSLALFLISATLHGDGVDARTEAVLDAGGPGLTSPTTTLVLGSDRRTRDTAEPGGSTTGPSRADSIVLVRSGGGRSAKLSIPRDTIVEIPGHGRTKVNAAYAFGGAALMVETLKQYLGIEINHVFEVSFEDFPNLIDAMGGVRYSGSCVISKINGGFENGGYTLRLPGGTTHIDGREALALARTRTNLCNRSESDLTRARRQQKILAAMKSRVFSPAGFIRLPLISWNAPKSVRSDMNGPALLAYAVGTALSGGPETRVLKPSGGERLSDGGAGLVVSEQERRDEVRRFLEG